MHSQIGKHINMVGIGLIKTKSRLGVGMIRMKLGKNWKYEQRQRSETNIDEDSERELRSRKSEGSSDPGGQRSGSTKRRSETGEAVL